MSELDRVIARLREDPSFARITVKRDGDNLKSWIPPLSKAEIKKAVQAAGEAHQIEPPKPRTEPKMSRAEREAQAHGERVAAALRAKDARDRAEIQKKRDERARAWQLRGCKFLGLHKWNGCTCAVCAATRDADHEWSGCRCVQCRPKCGIDWLPQRR